MDILLQYGWLIVLIIAIILEAVSLGLTTIWFAFGALAAWLVSLAVDSLVIQIVVFLMVSLALLLGMRPLAVKWLKIGRHRTNADALVGQEGFVTEAIEPLMTTGQVKVGSQTWTAISKESLLKGEKVKILEIQGVKLVVKKAN